MSTPQPRFPTPQACQAWLRANGINVTQWCREHSIDRQVVADLLRGGIGFQAERTAPPLRSA